jgi:hypothetical protein
MANRCWSSSSPFGETPAGTQFVQLGEYLKEKDENLLNVVALAWTEGAMDMHPKAAYSAWWRSSIKVIRETPKIVDAFSPLVDVPANFVFDKGGKRPFGDGQRDYIDKDRLAEILAGAK